MMVDGPRVVVMVVGQVASRERRDISSLIETGMSMEEAMFGQLFGSYLPCLQNKGLAGSPHPDVEFVGRLVGIVSRGKM